MQTILAAASLLLGVPAVAHQASPAAGPAGTTEEKPICRRIQVTGSNFSKRECHTPAEWKAIRARDEANAERALDNRAPRNGSGQ